MAKKILKRISLICLALLVGVGAFLLPTLNSKSNNKQLSHFAHADSVDSFYDFNGSNLWFPTEVLTYGGADDPYNGYPWAGVVWSNFYIRVQSGTYDSAIDFIGLYVESLAWDNALSLNNNSAIDFLEPIHEYTNVTQDIQDINIQLLNVNYYDSYVRFYIKSNDWQNVTANFTRVTIGQILYEWNSFITYCRYYDTNSNYIEVSCVTLSDYNRTSSGQLEPGVLSALTIPTRSYTFTTFLSDNEIYQQGVLDGEVEGFENGKNQGYTQGYSRGFEEGKNYGYNEALNNNNPYTFDALISSVLDVPVRTFTSLFNFTILGVNLAEFMLGLFTFCIIITLVRWCL